MNIHFISIGGSAMHNLAIALQKKGYNITGSDDEIFEPAKSRLDTYNLLPPKIGWFETNIHQGIDAVILGMHAKNDNPELIKAKKLNLKIFSYPEYIYQQSKNKTRIVIGGSHGKTTITAMVIHVMNYFRVDCDFLVGAMLDGFDVMVKITDNAKYMILEGDEYLSSTLDPRPKFHLYNPDIALISGIAWDHINVFPTFEIYSSQFAKFIDFISPNGTLIFNEQLSIINNQLIIKDNDEKNISFNLKRNDLKLIPYSIPEYNIDNGITSILYNNKSFPLKVFGNHNLANIEGARNICNQIGINSEDFYSAITSFNGASKRLELMAKNLNASVFKDFAHSPSKLFASINAVKNQFPDRKLIACVELHTFSSLNAQFLPLYKSSMNNADVAIVYFSNHAIEMKNLPPVSPQQIKKGFDKNDLLIFNDADELKKYLSGLKLFNCNLLLMSSGDFNGLNINEIANNLINPVN